METKTSSNVDAYAGMNKTKENKTNFNGASQLAARAHANHVKTRDNNQQETDDIQYANINKTTKISTLGSRADTNPAQQIENVYKNYRSSGDPKTRDNHHEIYDAVEYAKIITKKGTSTLGSKADTNPVKEIENRYMNEKSQAENIGLPEPATSDCSRVEKLRKAIIISVCVNIGLIIVLAILASASLWLHSDRNILQNIVRSLNREIDEYKNRVSLLENLVPTQKQDISDVKSKVVELRTTLKTVTASDCSEVYRSGRTESGVYTITLQGQTVSVYCDMKNGGGWTMFQNRIDGSVDFYRTWSEYKSGFGDVQGEFWWGNDHLAALTATKQYTLRVDLSDWLGDTAYALYTNFRVAAESDNYRLTAEGYTGTAGENDALHWSSGEAFSTRDRDNDHDDRDCARDWHHAGGWFRHCAWANPNGRYGGPGAVGEDMMSWWYWKNYDWALKTFSMKARPADF